MNARRAVLPLVACLGACGLKDYTFENPMLTVTLTSPASTVYTRGTVAVQVLVSGGTPESVELLRDGAVLVALTAPYQYNWDTTGAPEGNYQLSARATYAGQSFTSDPRTIVVDRTPPTIATRTPGPGATNVFVDDPISVVFSKPVLPATVNTGSVSLRSTTVSVAATPSLSTDGKTLTITRDGSFTIPNTLTVNLSNAITDLAGNFLATTSWSWDLPDWVIVGPALNPTARDIVYTPALSLDGNGQPVVAVQEFDGAHNNVYVRQWTGGAWQAVGGPVNAVPGQGVSLGAAMTLDTTGKPFVAFIENTPARYNVYVQQWNGTAWQAVGGPVNAIPTRDVALIAPALVLDGTGKPVVAFIEYDGSHSNLYVQQWTGAAWQAVGGPVNAIPTRDLYGITPALAIDGTGKPVVAFVESDATPKNNLYVYQWTGTTWQAIGSAVNATGRDVLSSALTLDATGKPVVAFYEYDTTATPHLNVYVYQWSGSIWQTIGGPVNAVAGQHATAPFLSLDPTGKPVVAFRESDGSRYSAYVQQWTGSVWRPVGPGVHVAGGSGVATDVVMSLDRTGKAVISFAEYDGMHLNVYVRHSNQ